MHRRSAYRGLRRWAAFAALIMLPMLTSADQPESIDAKLRPIFADWDRKDTPGMSVAVIKHGKLIYSRGFGSAQLEYAVPISPQTIFHVASVSKQFTAMAILLLEAEGRLSFDDEIHKYLPWVPKFDHPVTIRQLANHTSGIRDQWELLTLAGWRMDDVISMDDIRGMMEHQRELNFPPQTDTLYSNMGYTLLAEIVATVSGMPFEQYTQEKIFRPLGMTHTHFHASHEEVVKGRAYSYYPGGDGQWRNSVLSYSNVGATSLFTTAPDMTLWLDNFRTMKVGGPAVLAKLQEAPKLSNGKPSLYLGVPYAGGVSLSRYRGARMIGQAGVDAGFRAEIEWFPEQELGIAVLSNVATGDPSGHLLKIADALLAKELGPAEPDIAQRKPVRVEASKLQSYEGLYHWFFGTIAFAIDNGALVAKLGGGTIPLTALSDTEFLLPFAGRKNIVHFKAPTGPKAQNFDLEVARTAFPGSRLTTATLPKDDIPKYVGSYYSPELRTGFEIGSDAQGLIIHHHRHGDMRLLAEQEPASSGLHTLFAGEQWLAQKVVFEKDSTGAIRGLRLTGISVRNLWFQKVSLP